MTDRINNIQICSRGVWDSTVPGIFFDDNGVSNYAHMLEDLIQEYPRGEKGKNDWAKIVDKVKQKGKNKKYDCIIGISGGTDSSYLLHLAKEYNLKPLAVNLDNGWNSEISVKNIKKLTSDLNIDLETYVIDYEEMKDILRSYIRASFPWIDVPTDMAIQAVLYKIASREKIKYIFNGADFRSEGKQPVEWTYSDSRQLKYIFKTFGSGKLKTFPYLTFTKLFYLGFVKRIKVYRPFYYLEYQKKNAQAFLSQQYGWEYYGGHHHENVFTKFAISYWLPKKFNIDKRLITLSAQILSGEINRTEALNMLFTQSYDSNTIVRDINYVLKKLNIKESEFEKIMLSENKYYFNYPSNYKIRTLIIKFLKPFIKLIVPIKLPVFFEMESRKQKKS